jgi:hypothetical protein
MALIRKIMAVVVATIAVAVTSLSRVTYYFFNSAYRSSVESNAMSSKLSLSIGHGVLELVMLGMPQIDTLQPTLNVFLMAFTCMLKMIISFRFLNLIAINSSIKMA